MKYNFLIFRNLVLVGIVLLSQVFTEALYSQQNTGKKEKSNAVSINLKVTDEAGNPLPDVKVVVGEGDIHTETDEQGVISFSALPEDRVTLTSGMYEKTVISVKELFVQPEVKLIRAKLFMKSDDDIPLPLKTIKKRYIPGNAITIRGDVLVKYPTNDLRNALAGIVPGLEIIENNGAPGMSAEEKLGLYGATEKVSLYTRGRSPIFLIDDMPVDITEMQLDPQEIESVTVIKDIVGKAMYGPMAADGIILIETKRGIKNDRVIEVNAETGFGINDRFPEWSSGTEYAGLNNTARTNDGLVASYDDKDISEYGKNDPYDMYHPNINFREMMLKNSRSFSRVNLSYQGGNDETQYYAIMNYNGDGDIYEIGPTADFNRVTTRANLDIKINDPITIKFDFYGGLTFRRSPNYGYSSGEGSGAMDLIEFDRVLDDITSISPVAFPVYANNDPALKAPWYGVNNPTFPDNPVGRLLGGGYYNEKGRNASIATTLVFDMSNILKGLKSNTYMGYNTYNLLRIGKAEDYIAYNVIPSQTTSGADTILLTKAHDGIEVSDESNLHDYYYDILTIYENLNYDRTFGDHGLQTSLSYYISRKTRNGVEEPMRQQNLVFSGLYSYKDKYTIQGVLNYAGTYSFDEGDKYALFPSLGASWVISDENFMSGLQFVNYLKLRAEAGILGYESFLPPYYYNDRWLYNNTGTQFGPAPVTPYWFGNTSETGIHRNSPNRIGNPDLTWEKRKEFNIGLDALLLNNRLLVSTDYYHNVRDGIITQVSQSIPYVLGISGAVPWSNYNKFRYYGIETSLSYSDKVGSFRYSIGGSFTVQNSEILKYDEPDYSFEYQTRVGKPVDSYWGQTYLGKFGSDAEAMVIPQIYDAVLHEGDLKYSDVNGDGFVDDNDISMIGHTTPRLYYALNAMFSYKNFDMTIIGTGRAFYDVPLTNSYFWNGWGDNNYSAFVRDNIDGAYPRLTYYKVNNNFVNSSFWLDKGGYFKVQNIELAYNIPAKPAFLVKTAGIRIYLRGANLLTLSKIKDLDPESISSGVEYYPLFRTFSGGIKLTF